MARMKLKKILGFSLIAIFLLCVVAIGIIAIHPERLFGGLEIVRKRCGVAWLEAPQNAFNEVQRSSSGAYSYQTELSSTEDFQNYISDFFDGFPASYTVAYCTEWKLEGALWNSFYSCTFVPSEDLHDYRISSSDGSSVAYEFYYTSQPPRTAQEETSARLEEVYRIAFRYETAANEAGRFPVSILLAPCSEQNDYRLIR